MEQDEYKQISIFRCPRSGLSWLKVEAMLGMSASVVNVESMGRLRLATVEVAVLSVIIVTSLMIKILAKTTTWRQWR